MRRSSILALLVITALVLATSAVAQNNCVDVKGVAQAFILSNVDPVDVPEGQIPTNPLSNPFGWGGYTTFIFGGQNYLAGFFSGADGNVNWRGPGMKDGAGLIGQGKGGTYTFGFNFTHTFNIEQVDIDGQGTMIPVAIAVYKDTFTTSVANAIYPLWPGMKGPAYGFYQASHKLVPEKGTGIFKNATGTLLITGTYIVGVDQYGNFSSRWNPDITGKICGLQ